MSNRVLCKAASDRLMTIGQRHPEAHLSHSAYHTGLSTCEIIKLLGDRVDAIAEIIRLRSDDMETEAGRIIPMTKELWGTLKNVRIYLEVRGYQVAPVFIYKTRHTGSIRRALEVACWEARITDEGYSFFAMPSCATFSELT